MSATIALFRIQAHALFWPFWICVAVWLAGYAMGSLETFGVMVSAAIVGCWIAGGLVFGIEYMEGARDYMATRPVSAGKVLWTKVATIFAFVLVCFISLTTLSANPSFTDYGFQTGGFLAMLLLAALVPAAFTVLFKDLVRGLLGSGALLGVAGLLLYNHRQSVLVNRVIDASSGLRRLTGEPFIVVCFDLVLVLSPLLVLGFLIAIYQSRASHRLCLPIPAFLLSGIGAAGMAVIVYSGSLDGESSFNHLYAPSRGTWQVDGNELIYLDDNSGGLHVETLDLNRPDMRPVRRSIVPRPREDGFPLAFCGDVMTRVSMSKVGKFNYRVNGIEMYRRIGPASAELTASEPVRFMRHDLQNRSIIFLTPGGQWRRASCCSGEIVDETRPPGIKEDDLDSGQIHRDERTGADIQQASEGGWTARLLPAGFSAPVREIEMVHTGEGNADVVRIPVPARFQSIPNVLVRIWLGLGFESDELRNQLLPYSWNLSLTLGGGFLCVWDVGLNRVAVWRVEDMHHPEFMGIAPTPEFTPDRVAGLAGPDPASGARVGNAVPYVRADGALGFLLEGYGVLWLEFPALMHKT